MNKKLLQFVQDEKAQGLAEYVIIAVSLIAATVFVDSAFREALRAFYNRFSGVVGGPRP